MKTAYVIGYWISFVILFIAFWIYCIADYGFLVGVGIGWLPSAIAAGVLSAIWPLLLLVVIILIAKLSSG